MCEGRFRWIRVDFTFSLLVEMDSHGVLEARQHIQNHSAGGDEIFYWGYATRVFPCTNDAGSCAYLDAVYWYVSRPGTIVDLGIDDCFLCSLIHEPHILTKSQH